MVVVLIGVIGAVSIVKYVDLSTEAQANVTSSNDGSMWARLTAASQDNYSRATRATTGTRVAKWEYSCMAGNQVAQMLDDRQFEGGYGGMWYRAADGTPDFSRFWALGPDDTPIPHGEMKECNATRDGKTYTFMVWGCRSEACGCNTYPSDCANY